MNLAMIHEDCPALTKSNLTGLPLDVSGFDMKDMTRDPEILDRNVERPFRVFRCSGCEMEVKVEKLGG